MISTAWLFVGAVIAVVSIVMPNFLTLFYKIWMQLGQLMGKVVSPLTLFFIFLGLITPVGLITRLFGRDELRLKRNKSQTYWIDRTPPGPAGDSFKNQF